MILGRGEPSRGLNLVAWHNPKVAREQVARFLSDRLEVWQGDITEDDSEAIVNAANRQLLGGGGVDGAIHAAGGPRILLACLELRRSTYLQGLPTGQAVITTGGDLRAKYVIHAVGPRWGQEGGREAELLEQAYNNSLKVALKQDLKTIAFPAISTGIYGFPKEKASDIVAGVCTTWLAEHETWQRIRLYFFSLADARGFCSHGRLLG